MMGNKLHDTVRKLQSLHGQRDGPAHGVRPAAPQNTPFPGLLDVSCGEGAAAFKEYNTGLPMRTHQTSDAPRKMTHSVASRSRRDSEFFSSHNVALHPRTYLDNQCHHAVA